MKRWTATLLAALMLALSTIPAMAGVKGNKNGHDGDGDGGGDGEGGGHHGMGNSGEHKGQAK